MKPSERVDGHPGRPRAADPADDRARARRTGRATPTPSTTRSRPSCAAHGRGPCAPSARRRAATRPASDGRAGADRHARRRPAGERRALAPVVARVGARGAAPGGDRRALAEDSRRSRAAHRSRRAGRGARARASGARATCRTTRGACSRRSRRRRARCGSTRPRSTRSRRAVASFRATLGHAIDALSRDRSRELAHLEAIAALRGGIQRGDGDGAARRRAPARDARLGVRGGAGRGEPRSRVGAADLDYQIETLQRQLDVQNGELEAELADATGMLEGGAVGRAPDHRRAREDDGGRRELFVAPAPATIAVPRWRVASVARGDGSGQGRARARRAGGAPRRERRARGAAGFRASCDAARRGLPRRGRRGRGDRAWRSGATRSPAKAGSVSGAPRRGS